MYQTTIIVMTRTHSIEYLEIMNFELCHELCFLRQDFKIYMDDWPTLCRMDSDNDNRTNGEELGDPDCDWINKDDRIAVSHPGNATSQGQTMTLTRDNLLTLSW